MFQLPQKLNIPPDLYMGCVDVLNKCLTKGIMLYSAEDEVDWKNIFGLCFSTRAFTNMQLVRLKVLKEVISG